MKTIILILLSFNLYGQETIYRNLENTSLTRFKTDSTEYYSLYFQDETYQHIVSLKYILFKERDSLDLFFDRGFDVLETKDAYNGSNYSLKKVLGQLYIYKDGAWFTMTKKQLLKMQSKL